MEGEWIANGKALGYEGPDLLVYVNERRKELHDRERDERAERKEIETGKLTLLKEQERIDKEKEEDKLELLKEQERVAKEQEEARLTLIK